ncbi:hypothetical protein SAMN06265348_12422 [Pedobacter westerhofensis]|uniref:Uncharacterized protein n=1 Tax=Pedobacter westerhofensis TaxID=425512 RepID=A0A521FVM4_9SPHI|nr:hypothetical protein SAMN06265348_12422 [Pedobacter westerhofensis]
MYRIIYYTSTGEYCIFDSADYEQIISIHLDLRRDGNQVVCIVNYTLKAVIYKSPDFDSRSDDIDDLIFNCIYN